MTQAHPSLEDGTLKSRISASGALAIEDPCQDPDAPIEPEPLPALETGDVPEGVKLDVPIHISWSDVSAAISRSVSNAKAGSVRIVKVEARGVAVDGANTVALESTLTGSVCGTAWFVAEPWFDERTSRVRLRKARLAPGQTSFDESDSVLRALEDNAAVALPVDVGSAPNAIEAMVEGLASDLPKSVRVTADMHPPKVERVLLDGEALVPIATLAGSAKTEVK